MLNNNIMSDIMHPSPLDPQQPISGVYIRNKRTHDELHLGSRSDFASMFETVDYEVTVYYDLIKFETIIRTYRHDIIDQLNPVFGYANLALLTLTDRSSRNNPMKGLNDTIDFVNEISKNILNASNYISQTITPRNLGKMLGIDLTEDSD